LGRPAIIIFGAALWPGGVPSPTLVARVDAAMRAGSRLSRPLYVPTGGIGRHGPSEASVMAAMLREHGVPAEDIIREETARDTVDSVRAVRALLRGHAGPVLAATSNYHLPRCLVLLRLAGLPARPCQPPPHREPPRMVLYRWGREACALPWDAALIATWAIRRAVAGG
jgi:uncharacterized SAM-binding protein YcdF (DUF218 family)